MKNNYSIDPKTNYHDTLKAYNLQGESPNSKHHEHKYLGKIGEALNKHKGKVITAIAEAYSIPFFANLRNVATDALVEGKLKIGEVIKYPLRVDLLPLPHTVDVSGQIKISPTSEYIPVVYELLKYVGSNPVVTIVAAASPLITYAGYRTVKRACRYCKNRKAKK
jgi:hypothetical protein